MNAMRPRIAAAARSVGLWLALSLALALGAAAQEQPVDYDAWLSFAQRAESVIEAERASNEALEQLRSDLVKWREQFLKRQNANAERIATLKSQLEALGPPPAEGEVETAEIAARRAELTAKLAEAQAPVKRAEEAYIRADGLIREIDAIIRDRQTRDLLELGPSPLNPVYWPTVWEQLHGTARSMASNAEVNWKSPVRQEAMRNDLPRIVLAVLAGLALLFRGGAIVGSVWESAAGRLPDRFARPAETLLSAMRALAPVVGVLLLVEAVHLTGIPGFRAAALLWSLPWAAFWFCAVNWIGHRLFDHIRGLEMPAENAAALHRSTTLLAGAFAALQFIDTLAAFNTLGPATSAVLYFPIVLLGGLVLFRMARVLSEVRRARMEETDALSLGLRWLSLGARGVAIASVVAVLLAAVGYMDAGLFVLRGIMRSLALIGLLMVADRFLRDLYCMVTGADDDALAKSLIPTFLSFVLVLASLPAFALIWGARVADLTELWTRFRAGFKIGDVQISPQAFVTFVAVFGALYVATRAIQGALRASVLPKTRLDPGAQNALVSGVGYIGIFLAAVVAISSAGIDLSSLAIVAGALSVGIGFGLQNIVQNFVSGIILLIERPVAEGDWIEVGGHMGIVRDISVRSTRIETFDRNDVIVPNADFISSAVKNWTRGNKYGRIIIPVGVAYGTDTRKVEAILREIANDHPMVSVDPPPLIEFMRFGASSLDFELRAVIPDIFLGVVVRTELRHRIIERFAEEGIEIPFTQTDIWLRNPEAFANLARQELPKPGAEDAADRTEGTGESEGNGGARPGKEEDAA